jgi:hypothetical protein
MLSWAMGGREHNIRDIHDDWLTRLVTGWVRSHFYGLPIFIARFLHPCPFSGATRVAPAAIKKPIIGKLPQPEFI